MKTAIQGLMLGSLVFLISCGSSDNEASRSEEGNYMLAFRSLEDDGNGVAQEPEVAILNGDLSNVDEVDQAVEQAQWVPISQFEESADLSFEDADSLEENSQALLTSARHDNQPMFRGPSNQRDRDQRFRQQPERRNNDDRFNRPRDNRHQNDDRRHAQNDRNNWRQGNQRHWRDNQGPRYFNRHANHRPNNHWRPNNNNAYWASWKWQRPQRQFTGRRFCQQGWQYYNNNRGCVVPYSHNYSYGWEYRGGYSRKMKFKRKGWRHNSGGHNNHNSDYYNGYVRIELYL